MTEVDYRISHGKEPPQKPYFGKGKIWNPQDDENQKNSSLNYIYKGKYS